MVISIIAAMDLNRVIGNNNQMPWHLPADFTYFKNTTMGKPLVMGRKTYDSIGKALPGRRNIIVSHQQIEIPHCEVVHSLEEALALLQEEAEIFIIGGATLFTQALPLAQRLYLTLIEANFPGDTYFPNWDPNHWHERKRTSHKADAKNAYDYQFLVLNKRALLQGTV